MEIKCPYKFCGKTFTPDAMEYTKIGRIVFCPHCHGKVLMFKNATIKNAPPGKGKEHMSKKERMRRRQNESVK